MKCPSCKKKPVELVTKRTLASGRAVTRERYCPKCKNRFYTLEQFVKDLKEKDEAREKEFSDLRLKLQKVESRNSEIMEGLAAFNNLLKEA